MDIKPGYLTSEMWLVVVTTILSFLAAFGVISQEEAATWKELIVPLVPGIIAVAAYIWSRTQVKTKT
jgi:hypothetical protein